MLGLCDGLAAAWELGGCSEELGSGWDKMKLVGGASSKVGALIGKSGEVSMSGATSVSKTPSIVSRHVLRCWTWWR